MFHRLRVWLSTRRLARLERLTRWACEIDELLAFGRLLTATRAHLQARREELQRQAREMMFG